MEMNHFLSQTIPRWMQSHHEQDDIVMSTRIRLARNLSNFRFPLCFSESEAMQVDRMTRNVFVDDESQQIHFSYFPMKEITTLDRQVLFEKHLISPQLARKEQVGAVLLSDDESISILINEEDHLRIQCLAPGFQLMDTYAIADQIDRMLERELDFAYHEEFGYLTSCPTNVGTGLRASVMMHLPALTMTKQMDQLMQTMTRIGMTVRGSYGEGSGHLGNVYQVSNQLTLGRTEQEILTDLQLVAEKIMRKEHEARQTLVEKASISLEDRLYRSLGTLITARILTSEEAATSLSNVRLGIELGIIKHISKNILLECMSYMQPGLLQRHIGMHLQPEERDIYRAQILRELLNSELATPKNIEEKGDK